MKKRLNILLKGLLCMSAAWLFYSCSDDSGTAEQNVHEQNVRELHVVLGSQQYEDVTPSTRTTLPEGYEEYNYSTALVPFTQIQGYMTIPADIEIGTDEKRFLPCLFSYSATEDNWTSRIALEDQTYYFYGFMPREDIGGSVSIAAYGDDPTTPAVEGDYKDGAVLTFDHLNAVTSKDLCIVVGMKGYKTTPPIADMSDRLGCFDYDPRTDAEPNAAYLYLLVDHIYSGLEFQMKVNSKYDELRTIKIKSIKLMADNGENSVETIKTKVTVQAGSATPMSVETVGSYQRGSGNGNAAVLYESDNSEGKALTTEYQSFLACLWPNVNHKFVLETKYDVYDKKGNRVREDQTARNAITLQHSIPVGTKYIVNIEVTPTFLYVLSDADLDNPTFKVAN
jgi:hypothetical protein